VKLVRLVLFRICRVSLAGICLFPLVGHCQSVQDSAPAFLQSIAVSPRVSSIVTGATQQFTAIGTYSDGHKKNITSSVTWNSSAKRVATIRTGGLATGVAAGQTKIIATLLSIHGSALLTVTPALVSIAVTPAGTTIVVGNSQQFTATGTFSDGSTKDITSSVAWSSSATDIVSISNTGLANALIGGVPPGGPPAQVTITATLGSVTGSTTLTVTDNLTSIALSPSSVTLNVGAQQTFTATGSYQDGTTADITALALWSSSDTAVLTIVANGSGAGTATAVAVGAVTVTAAENGINGTATVTVTKAPPPPGAITPSFFGMTIGDTAPYPPSTVPIGAIGHPTMLAWDIIEHDRGVYKFEFYDKFAYWASSHNVPFMVTFGWTPTWASSKCAIGEICTYPPDNIQDWVDFITEVVIKHYNGVDAPNIQYYELWDETNDGTFWSGKLDQLVALAQAAYPIIHQNPVSLLLTPSTSGSRIDAHDWMIAYLRAGGAQYADGGTFHGYLAPQGGSPPYPFPEDSDVSGYGDIVTRAATFRLLFDLYGLQGKPMFDTEGSWGKAQIPDPNQQAAWLARWYLLQAGAGTVESAYWLAWGNSAPKKPIEEQWGLITDYYDQITPTAAGIAYGQVYDWLVDAAISPCTSSANIWTCALIRSGKYQGLAVWFYSASETDTTSYTPDPQFVRYRDLAGNVTPVSGDITIGAQPILLESEPPP
jgi:Bacterial Ig-like domain (group 2)